MPRQKTPEQKAAWAEYMRQYRANRPEANVRNDNLAPTPRQLEILRIYVDPELGGSQERVAKLLGISKSAVHNQMQRLMRRLDVHTPAQAVMKLWVTTNDTSTSSNGVPQPPPRRRLHRPRPPEG